MEGNDDAWLRALDSDLSPEALSREMSVGLLMFVKEEGTTLDTIKRAKVLMSLLYLSDDQLKSLEGAILSLCEACEQDAEEWIRQVSGVVGRWLRMIPKDRDDAFMLSTQQIAKMISANELNTGGKFSLPGDVLPTHWPFLATQALPEFFDISDTGRNPHFRARPRGEHKKLKVVVPAETAAPEDVLPEKVKELLATAPLLKEEDRETLLKFFRAPTNCGLTGPVEILLSETRMDSKERPGHIEIVQQYIKLDPVENKWNPKKKRRLVAGKV